MNIIGVRMMFIRARSMGSTPCSGGQQGLWTIFVPRATKIVHDHHRPPRVSTPQD
jgi:hypothetical protein